MKTRRRGFTLIEILAVMAILALLAGLGVRGYSLVRRQAKEGRARAEIQQLSTALEEYRVEFDAYPGAGHQGDVSALKEIDWLQAAVEELPEVDPWGRAYQYRHAAGWSNRFRYSIWSMGHDPATAVDDIHE